MRQDGSRRTGSRSKMAARGRNERCVARFRTATAKRPGLRNECTGVHHSNCDTHSITLQFGLGPEGRPAAAGARVRKKLGRGGNVSPVRRPNATATGYNDRRPYHSRPREHAANSMQSLVSQSSPTTNHGVTRGKAK